MWVTLSVVNAPGRLASEGKYKVRAVGRSAERAKQVLGLDNVDYASADTKDVSGEASRAACRGSSC